MKNMKKILALLVAVLLIAASVSALAAPTDTTLKVNAVEGHKYTAFQLFVGDLAGDGKTLSNVNWGTDVAASITYKIKANADATTYTVDKTISPKAGDPVPQEVLDYLSSLSGKTETDDAQDTADIIGAWVTGEGAVIPEDGLAVKTGYYVVKDAYTDATADQTTTLSTMMCEVVGPTTITPKAGTTEHKKEVADVNDTETTLNLDNLIGIADWGKSADYDIGDKVPFKLTTKIASDFAKYDSYYLAVSDTLHDGLELDQNSIVVYVDDVVAQATAITTTGADGGYNETTDSKSFKIEFLDLSENENAAAGKEVVVTYLATLTDAAVIGNPGNLNESYAEFSNNPNGNQQGKGKTPTDTAVVFTFKTDVDKIDPEGTPLPNAGFTLYKKYAAAQTGKSDNVSGTTPAGAKEGTFPANQYWYAVKTINAGAGTNFEFKGIDDGTYILVESETPDGYNTMDPITLVVTATHDADKGSSTGYSVSALNVDNESFEAAANGGEIKFTKKNATEKTLESGEIYSEIVNNSGTTLPSTGGIGTTIFYVAGGILVLAAVILLVTKRRMNADD